MTVKYAILLRASIYSKERKNKTVVFSNGCLCAYSRQPGTPFCSCMSNQSACLSVLFTSHHFHESSQPRRWLFLSPQSPLPPTHLPAAEALCQCWWCSEKGRGWMVQEKAIHVAGRCRSVWRCTHLCKSVEFFVKKIVGIILGKLRFCSLQIQSHDQTTEIFPQISSNHIKYKTLYRRVSLVCH